MRGWKIRRQYFNIILAIGLFGVLLPFAAILARTLKNDGGTQFSSVEEMASFLLKGILMLFLLLLLSLCNALFFGRCICVLTEDVIYSHQPFIRWQDVNEMVFHLGLPSKNRWNYSDVEVKGHDFTALFPSAPCRMLR